MPDLTLALALAAASAASAAAYTWTVVKRVHPGFERCLWLLPLPLLFSCVPALLFDREAAPITMQVIAGLMCGCAFKVGAI